jgi:3-methyladenine DNA glycosylase AlkD
MHYFIKALEDTFQKQVDPQRSSWQQAYMKNQFVFLGIQKPQRSQLEKVLFKQYSLTNHDDLIKIITLLWQKEEREFHYTGCEIAYYYKKLWNADSLNIFEYMIRNKSWWDSVDDIAANLVGPLVFKYPELVSLMDQWIDDDNLWIRRSALLFQLRWKKQTDEQRLFSYCIKRMHEKDFFIRKAIGWVLREYSKTNAEAVRMFIDTHRSQLSGLSIREASKYLLEG